MRFGYEDRPLGDGTTRRMMTGRAQWSVWHLRDTLYDGWDISDPYQNGPCCIDFCSAWTVDETFLQRVDPRTFAGHRGYWVNQGEEPWQQIGLFNVTVEMLDWNDDSSTPTVIDRDSFLAARKRVLYDRATTARVRAGLVGISSLTIPGGGNEFRWSAETMTRAEISNFVPGAGECFAESPGSHIYERFEGNPASRTAGYTQYDFSPEACVHCLSDCAGPLENYNRVWPIDGPVLAARVIFS